MTYHSVFQPDPIPATAGVGLKPQHFRDILETKPAIGWFEVHPENYMGEGGSPHAYLTDIRSHYSLSCHGVGLSLGGVGPLDADHLYRLRDFVSRYEPGLVSEHLAWSAHDGHFLNDLLPLPLTDDALDLMVEHVDQMQEALGRQVLVENPSTYLTFKGETMKEADFLIALARRTGCKLLFDVNNVYVSARNHGFDAAAYIDAVPGSLIGEVHLAGHAVEVINGVELRIDDHGSEVVSDVWYLYERLIARVGPKPSLIEWDTNIPAWPVLFFEAQKADILMKQHDLVLGRRHGHE
ncbi:MAG: DUF692 domain-containing protein [Parvibaculum sp.]